MRADWHRRPRAGYAAAMVRPCASSLLLGVALAQPGCRQDPWHHSAQAALGALEHAARRGDVDGIYYLLDERSRWSIATLARTHGEAVRTIEQAFPPSARPQALARFVGATDEPAFAAELARRRHWLETLRASSPLPGQIRCDAWKRCGFTGLERELGELVENATHHLASVKDSASAYEAGKRLEPR